MKYIKCYSTIADMRADENHDDTLVLSIKGDSTDTPGSETPRDVNENTLLSYKYHDSSVLYNNYDWSKTPQFFISNQDTDWADIGMTMTIFEKMINSNRPYRVLINGRLYIKAGDDYYYGNSSEYYIDDNVYIDEETDLPYGPGIIIPLSDKYIAIWNTGRIEIQMLL